VLDACGRGAAAQRTVRGEHFVALRAHLVAAGERLVALALGSAVAVQGLVALDDRAVALGVRGSPRLPGLRELLERVVALDRERPVGEMQLVALVCQLPGGGPLARGGDLERPREWSGVECSPARASRRRAAPPGP
jgi:hypothetical protein